MAQEPGSLSRFIELCGELEDELIRVIDSGQAASQDYPNAGVALRNISSWKTKAESECLPPSNGMGLGVSKSDLGFGRIEERLYALEDFYRRNL